MNAGVPLTLPSAVSRTLALARSRALELDQPEVEDLDEVPPRARTQLTTMLAGLMSRWTRPFRCASSSEAQTCVEEVDRALGRHRAEALDQRVEVHAVEQLHHVVERAVVGHAEVVELHRVRRLEPGGRARLALEPAEQELGRARRGPERARGG